MAERKGIRRKQEKLLILKRCSLNFAYVSSFNTAANTAVFSDLLTKAHLNNGLPDQMSPEWVAANNIASVHSDVFGAYNGKTLRLRGPGGQEIDAVVYDMCSDDDCSGCCTQNMQQTGFLIDLEIHTADRFGVYGGVVEFTCLDCEN